MNNEPVAWIPKDHLKEMGKAGFRYTGVSYQEDKFYDIPLYTHPVKEQDESFDRTASHMVGEYVSWTSCVACGQRVTGDSIHTCSPQLKQLTDEEWNKAFDFYCETDEGVLKFDLELRDEWKREQLIRWKEALRKAQEK